MGNSKIYQENASVIPLTSAKSSGADGRRPASALFSRIADGMKLIATIVRSVEASIQSELRDIERAVATGTRDAGRGLRTELRQQVTSAGLGQRLANAWRDKHYPNQRLDSASLVYTKAPQIIRAFDEGALIRSRRALSGDPDRERAEERQRWQADQPEHLPGAPLRAAPDCASAERAVASGGGRLTRLIQPADR